MFKVLFVLMKIMARQRLMLILFNLVLIVGLASCTSYVNRHGHVFSDEVIRQVQAGMSKDQVKVSLGTPDATSTIGGGTFYYISSTQRHAPFLKPTVIDRKVLAIYFDESESVTRLANYSLQDGQIVNHMIGETPSKGSDLSMIEQFFGNLGNRAGNLGKKEDDLF